MGLLWALDKMRHRKQLSTVPGKPQCPLTANYMLKQTLPLTRLEVHPEQTLQHALFKLLVHTTKIDRLLVLPNLTTLLCSPLQSTLLIGILVTGSASGRTHTNPQGTPRSSGFAKLGLYSLPLTPVMSPSFRHLHY